MSRIKITLEQSFLTEAAKKAKEYHEKMKTDAEERILKKFPERIVFLNELLKKPEFKICAEDVDFTFEVPLMKKSEIYSKKIDEQDSGKRKREDDDDPVPVLESMTVPANKHNYELVQILKPIIKQLLEDVKALKIWLSLLIPKIEDGNNFGVSIQEETLAEIQQVENEAMNYLDQIFSFNIARAKYITKAVKYPYAEDYRRSIEELDERQRLIVSLNMHDICNRYSNLHDIVIKNYEKIKKPRSSNIVSLY